jgi:hypothetical protein
MIIYFLKSLQPSLKYPTAGTHVPISNILPRYIVDLIVQYLVVRINSGGQGRVKSQQP